MPGTPVRPRLFWALIVINIVFVAIVCFITWRNARSPAGEIAVAPVDFADLPGWQTADLRAALAAFRRSCSVIAKYPTSRPMGEVGYAGVAADWMPACAAMPAGDVTAPEVRSYFERWFTPAAVTSAYEPLFTGYYEPTLSGSRTKNARFDVPIYGRPNDLVMADLSLFRHGFAGVHIYGRLSGTTLVPYASRAEIDSDGLTSAPILLYTDDPVGAFFLAIQGSGRVRFPDGAVERLTFAATNGRRYTSVGHVLIARGALDRKSVSMQTIRAWLLAHAADAQKVMEEDQSFVFYSLEPLGDATLGSPGTEGVPLTAEASVAVDSRVHPLGVPIYVATTIPQAATQAPDQLFDRLLIAQDTGGDIRGVSRFDIFFGAGREAESVAGRLKSRGRVFVLVPKPLAARLAPVKTFSEPPP